jgi:hypothetical protein
MSKEGYKGHRPGSNAGKIHKAYDDGGPEAAKKMGDKLGLEPHTVRAMLSIWSRGVKRGGTAKKKAKTPRVTRKTKSAKRPTRPVKSAKKAPAKKATAKKVVRVARAPKTEAKEAEAA